MQPANSQEADIELTRSLSIPIRDPEASPLLLSRAPSTLEQHLSSISRVPSTQQLLRQSSPLDSANEQLLRKASSIIAISNDQLSRRSSVIDFTTEQLSRKSSVINIANEPAALQPASSWSSMCAAAAEAAKLPPPPLRLSNSETCIESHTSVPSTPVAAMDLSQSLATEAAAPVGSVWKTFTMRAFGKAKAAQEHVTQQAESNLNQASVAAQVVLKVRIANVQDLVSTRTDLRASLRKAWVLLTALDSGPLALWLGRLAVASYYVNMVAEELEVWARLKDEPPVKLRWPEEGFAEFKFPFLSVLLLLPAALFTACGLVQPLASLTLLAYSLVVDAVLTYNQVAAIVRGGSRPTELMTKRLALIGATLLLVAHSLRGTAVERRYTGLLAADERRPEGRAKSIALLVGRLLVALLLLFAGASQLSRVANRGWQLLNPPADLSKPNHYGVPDAHDNSWVLLQLALALPMALGWKTAEMCRLLSWSLVAEALTCWPFWAWYWPSWYYAAHVRVHFFSNLAMAGGLVLLQCMGTGTFTIDQALQRKNQ
ncbi:MAG: hypothetical protein WDW36_000813 [Sanguina aurantia]